MEKIIKTITKSSFISSSILVLLGLLLFLKSDDTIVAISYLLGGTIIILGVIALIKYFRGKNASVINKFDIVYGIITIVFGAFILTNPTLVATVIPFVIGAWILIKSSIKITYAIELKTMDSPVWQSTLITSIISALVGVFMIFNPFKTSVIVFKIIGAAIITYSIMDIISTIQLRKTINKMYNATEEKNEDQLKEITTEKEMTEVVEADIEEIQDDTKEEPKKKPKKKTKKRTNKKESE